jgi:hypothetical protein
MDGFALSIEENEALASLTSLFGAWRAKEYSLMMEQMCHLRCNTFICQCTDARIAVLLPDLNIAYSQILSSTFTVNLSAHSLQ